MPYKVIANTKDLSHEDWLKIRKDYIGGSDASAVCGLNPWRSVLDVWMEKKATEIQDNPSYKMILGNKLEQTVAELFEEKTGKKVRRNNQMMVSEEYPFMLADIDREIVGEEAILECKTTSGWNRDQWKDGMVPIWYQLQVQHYMAVTGASLAYVACMIGFEDFVIREVERDEETIALLIDFEKQFYEGLKDPEWMPDPDGSSAYTEALRSKYSRSMANDDPVDLQMDIRPYFALEEEIKELTERKERMAQKMMKALGEAETGESKDAFVTWKSVTSNRFDSKSFRKDHPDLYEQYKKESTSRRFKVTKKEERK